MKFGLHLSDRKTTHRHAEGGPARLQCDTFIFMHGHGSNERADSLASRATKLGGTAKDQAYILSPITISGIFARLKINEATLIYILRSKTRETTLILHPKIKDS